jgi:serine/threonine protein kinase
MTPELWQQVRDVLAEALELSPEQRPAFLDRACSSDHILRREVDLLLSSDDVSRSSFLESSPLCTDLRVLDSDMTETLLETRLRAGERIGPYLVMEFLRAGGMGEVYKAIDTRLERTVAIKFLPAAFAEDPVALDRFQREARAASALNHPRICTIYDIGDHEGRPFFVMEFLEGKSLKDRIAARALPVSELLDLATQICDALQAAHAKGIVHRDIKPGNVFITTSTQVKVLDFGLAKRTDQEHQTATGMDNRENTFISNEVTLTRPGSVIGTLAYLSPEQARAEEVDARTDIYSLGVVLYEMATGRTAFRGDTSGELIHAILNNDPVKPSALNPAVSPRLERIILRALAKQRSTRYQTIADLSGALREVQQPKPRHSVWVRLAPALSALVLVALILTAVFRRSQNSGAPEIVQRQVTANPADNSVYNAALTEDGKQLAYGDLEGLHIRTIDTGEVHSLALPGVCFR